jgi:non-heme chloroperoxidase
MEQARTPVVFVHGLWLHADSWGAWVDLFREAGYDPIAPGWPGDSATVTETRSNSSAVAGYGINDVVDHYAKAISGLGAKPIAIGHSFGGLVVQRLLGQGLASAAVAIDPAPIKGVLNLPPSALKVASIALKNPANRKRAVVLTADQFRYGFGTQSPKANPKSSSSAGRSPRPASRCSKLRSRTSHRIQRPRSIPPTRREARS